MHNNPVTVLNEGNNNAERDKRAICEINVLFFIFIFYSIVKNTALLAKS